MSEELKITKYNHINVSDEVEFPYIVNVINGCFGRNYQSIYSCMRMTFCHIDDEHMAWFPKMATIKNGRVKAPARSQGWVNILRDDGMLIVEEKDGDTRTISGEIDLIKAY